jgi:hypothetical protein
MENIIHGTAKVFSMQTGIPIKRQMYQNGKYGFIKVEVIIVQCFLRTAATLQEDLGEYFPVNLPRR